MSSLRSGALVAPLFMLASAVAQGCGESHHARDSRQNPDSDSPSVFVSDGGVAYATVADCPTTETSFDTPPSESEGGGWSPAAVLSTALGSWENPRADSLVIERTGPLIQHQRTGRLRGGGTMPTDCAYYSDITMPLRVSLETQDGRLSETLEATLVLQGRSYVGFHAELAVDELNGSLSTSEPNDGTLRMSIQFSASGSMSMPAPDGGIWSVTASVDSKPIVSGNSASASAALVWLDDFGRRIDDHH